MVVDTKQISDALSRLSVEASGEKHVPGVLFNFKDGVLNVGYSDGHKAYYERVDVTAQEGDVEGPIALNYENLIRAIANCQPSGSILVPALVFKFNNGIMQITANQLKNIANPDAEPELKVLQSKVMDVAYQVINESASNQAKLLSRMNYESIFESEGEPDKWDRKELIEALTAVSTDKDKQIYISAKEQGVFCVNNQFTTFVPVDKASQPTQDDYIQLRGQLVEENRLEEYDSLAAHLGDTIHYSVSISTKIANCLTGILSKISSDEVYLHVKDSYICIYTPDEKIGIYTEQVKPSGLFVRTFNSFHSMAYNSYQMTFDRELLADIIKSVVNSSKSDKINLTFKKTANEDGSTAYKMLIASTNDAASIRDSYETELTSLTASDEAIEKLDSYVITVPIKGLACMVNIVKTPDVAFDIEDGGDQQRILRVAEINREKVSAEATKKIQESQYTSAMQLTVDDRMSYRGKTLGITSYAGLQK